MSGRCLNRRPWERADGNPRGGTLNSVKLLRADSATKRTATLTKPFSWLGEDTRKRTSALMRVLVKLCDHVALILNAIYRQYLRAAQGIANQGGKL